MAHKAANLKKKTPASSPSLSFPPLYLSLLLACTCLSLSLSLSPEQL